LVIIQILEEKRKEVMTMDLAGYFIRTWGESDDQVRRMIGQDVVTTPSGPGERYAATAVRKQRLRVGKSEGYAKYARRIYARQWISRLLF
jgi:hypothetical protein